MSGEGVQYMLFRYTLMYGRLATIQHTKTYSHEINLHDPLVIKQSCTARIISYRTFLDIILIFTQLFSLLQNHKAWDRG